MAAFPTGDVYFHVKVNLVSAIGIPSIKGEVPDVFFEINWDNFKYFKTDVERKNVNPVWKKVKEFYYETKYADQLDKKIVTFTCLQNQMMGDNVEIGIVDIDLMSIAAGCVLHDLPILTKHHRQRPGDPPTFIPTGARLRVEIEMNQLANMTIMLEDLKLHSFRVSKALRLAFKYGRELENQRSTFKTSKPSDVRADELRWPPTPISFYTSLVDLEAEFFHVMTVEGTAGTKDHLDTINIKIPFARILQTHGIAYKPVEFKESVIENGKTQCTFSCRMTLSDVPRFCQLVGGIHTEHGITGKPRYDGFIMPKHFIPESSLSPSLSRDKSPAPATKKASSSSSSSSSTSKDPSSKESSGKDLPSKDSSKDGKLKDSGKLKEPVASASEPLPADRPKKKRASATPQTPAGGASPQLARPASAGPYDAQQAALLQQQQQLQQMQIQPPQQQILQAPAPQRSGTPVAANGSPYGMPQNAGPTAASSAQVMPPLPPGWEAAVDANGKTYFIDHNSKSTSWFHPAAPPPRRRTSNPQQVQQQASNGLLQQQMPQQMAPQQQQYYPQQQQQQQMAMPQQQQQQQYPVGYAPGNPFAVQSGYGAPPQNGYAQQPQQAPSQPQNAFIAQPQQPIGFSSQQQQHQQAPVVQQPLYHSQPIKRKAEANSPPMQHSGSSSATSSPKPSKSSKSGAEKAPKPLKAPTSTASGAGIVGNATKVTVDSPGQKKRKS